MDNGIKDSKEISHDRVTKEREFEDDCCIHLVLFTAGTAVLMACLKKVLVVFLLEEWRAWIFVLLNLVLLAILFTSTLSRPKESQKESNNVEVLKIERSKKPRRKHSKYWSEQVIKREESEECRKTSGKLSSTNGCGEEEREMEPPRLSKEELNERAEAFIVMFRRHLVSDARKCGKEYLFERLERIERVKFQTLAK